MRISIFSELHLFFLHVFLGKVFFFICKHSSQYSFSLNNFSKYHINLRENYFSVKPIPDIGKIHAQTLFHRKFTKKVAMIRLILCLMLLTLFVTCIVLRSLNYKHSELNVPDFLNLNSKVRISIKEM